MCESRAVGLKSIGVAIASGLIIAILTACGGSGDEPTTAAAVEDLPVAEGAVVVVKAAPVTALQVSGAIFTTNNTCVATNENLFPSKDDVFLDGGPRKTGSAGLPPGDYFVKVTDPSGVDLLGQTPTASVVVDGSGDIMGCYQLSAILTSTGLPGPFSYLDTTNAGGEYKVWLSKDSSFPNNLSKTDNFKVGPTTTPAFGKLSVLKFYDVNANGVFDFGETEIVGWKINIAGSIGDQFTPYSALLPPDTYVVSEYMPIETNWYATRPKQFNIVLLDKTSQTVEFGNLCTGPGGGRTLGFWSNKNGAELINNSSVATLTALRALNLRNASGNNFDPTSYTQLRTWLLSGNAVNMAYMLSVQMSAMHLNVANNLVSGTALVYAPGAVNANALGFIQINALLNEANTELGLHGLVAADSPFRSYQEALKNALDNANNNLSFVQATPCVFTF
jgi:hypothetical protein